MLKPSKTRTAKVKKYRDRVCQLLQSISSEKNPIKSYRIQRTYDITDIVVRQIIGKLTIDELTDRMSVMSRRKQMLLKAQNSLLVEADGQLRLL